MNDLINHVICDSSVCAIWVLIAVVIVGAILGMILGSLGGKSK